MKCNPLLFTLIAVMTFACNDQISGTMPNSDSAKTPAPSGDTVQALGSSIMTIYQDQQNTMWFGSWETGVYRYDGLSLVNYSTKNGFPFDRIDEIKEDGSGNIFFTSCHPASMVVKFDGHSFATLHPIQSNDWQLNATDLWFKHAYAEEKVYRYDGENLFELQLPKPPNLSMPFEIYSIFKDKDGSIWFGANPVGACRYNGKTFDWITEEDVTEFRNEGANGVRSIVEDVNGDLWFNTEFRYTIDDTSIGADQKFYTRHKSIGGLDGKEDSALDEYLSAVRDDANVLWFVTYRDGVWKFDGTDIKQYKVQHDSADITLFSIYKDNSGGLWLGTHEHGAYFFNGDSFEPFILP